MRDRFFLRLVLLGITVFLAVALWRSWPGAAAWLSDDANDDAIPRAVIARGDLSRAMNQFNRDPVEDEEKA